MNDPTISSRNETDNLGEREVPNGALYGISTLRGSENFCVSNRAIGDEPELTSALAQIKWAAAKTNQTLGVIDPEVAIAIGAACQEITSGEHDHQFIIDMLEGSGGTSINMNANEVIANRATQILDGNHAKVGRVHPNDHVNLGQSTNDVVPSAVKLAAYAKSGPLVDALHKVSQALREKEVEFADVLRIGRTCMQAAQPMMLGQAFGGYASGVERAATSIENARRSLLVLPLGGTAIGTGLGCAPGYRERVFIHLSNLLGVEVTAPENMFDGMQNSDGFARFSSEVRVAAEVLGKIASDLVLLSSGPNSGLGEILLPAVQAGSSIMPGKINPVIPMLMQQVTIAVVGNDVSVSLACLQGQLEINHFEPVIASRLYDSIDMLTNSSNIFAGKCITGVRANREQSLKNLMDSSALATAFVPILGYENTSRIVKDAVRDKKPFVRVAIELGLLDEDDVSEALRKSTAYQPQNTG